MAKWMCDCGCPFIVEADKAPTCCGEKMVKAPADAKAIQCCCCSC